MLMQGGLLGVAFCLSVCLSVTNTKKKKYLEKNSLSQEPFGLWSPNLRGQKGQFQRSREVKVSIDVKEKAAEFMPTSSCHFFHIFRYGSNP